MRHRHSLVIATPEVICEQADAAGTGLASVTASATGALYHSDGALQRGATSRTHALVTTHVEHGKADDPRGAFLPVHCHGMRRRGCQCACLVRVLPRGARQCLQVLPCGRRRLGPKG